MKIFGAAPATTFLVAIMVVAGCQSSRSGSSIADITQVQDRTWVAETIEGEAASKGVDSTLMLAADGSAFGSTGCNRYTGSATVNGEQIRFGLLATTMMACPEPAMAQERRFTAALERVERWVLDGATLLLYAADGSTPPSRFKVQQ